MPFVSGSWRPFTPDEIEQVRAKLISLTDSLILPPPEPGRDYNADVSSLLGGEHYTWDDTRKITERLLLDHYLDSAPLLYYHVFNLAADLTRITGLRAVDDLAWVAAIPFIVRSLNNMTEQQAFELTRIASADLFAQANAAQRLRARGFAIGLNASRLSMEPTEYARLCNLAVSESEARSGSTLFGFLKLMLEGCWRPEFQRYVVSLNVNTVPRKDQPSLPLAYLYNLATRVASEGTRRGTSTLSDCDYLQLVTDLCAIAGVEPYNPYQVSFPSGTRLVEFLSDLARLQCAFVLPQFDERDLATALWGAFAWVDATMESTLGWSMDQAIAFCEATISLLHDKGALCIPRGVLKNVLAGVPEPAFEALWSTFVHAPAAANPKFLEPFDAPAVNGYFKPLIGIDSDNAVVGLRSVSATGWYESIAVALKTVAKINDTHDRIGLAFEPFVWQCLSPYGPVKHGKFSAVAASGDVDAALETDDDILVFELKKKALTRDAQTGSTVDVLLDLTKSVIKAQTQLAKVEYLLYVEGALQLSETGLLERRGRKVKRIVLSWHDYGVFHDHGFLTNFLRQLCGASLTATHTSRASSVAEINAQLAELAGWETKLSAIAARSESPQFVNSFFHAVGHLLSMIRSATTVDELGRHITFNERIMNNALNFYVEYERFRV